MQGHRPTGGGAEGGRGGEGVVVVPPPRPGGRQGGIHPAQSARALPSCHARLQPTYGGIMHHQLLDFLVVISLSFLGRQYLIKALVSSENLISIPQSNMVFILDKVSKHVARL